MAAAMSDILRWVCDQYRSELLAADPVACHRIDMLMVRAGQSWVCDDSVVDPDELVTATQIQDRHGISENAVRKLALRYGIEVRGKQGKYNLYRLGDVLSARAAKKSNKKFCQ